MAKVTVTDIRLHPRGQVYEVAIDGRGVALLLTFHALTRSALWGVTVLEVLQTLLLPEEVLRGHRGRFIAHRRTNGHIVRAVYEYDGPLPVVITVYRPSAKRYFQGRGIYEDRILS